MHIVVLGAGAVGGYFGAKLAKAGSNVTFLVREGRALQLKSKGLQIQSTYGDVQLEPTVAISTQDIENPDVVLVALKNYHLNDALVQLGDLVRKGAKLLPLLNGVEHMDILASEFGSENVLGGSCYIEATLDSEGRVLHTSPMQDIVFGSLDGKTTEWLTQLEREFENSGINIKLSPHIMQDMWKKFTFLVSFSAITATLRSPIGVALEDTFSNQLLQDLVHEILMVAEARNVGLQSDEVYQQMLQRLEKTPLQMTSSLHRDLEKGLPLEVDSLQGAVLRFAEAADIKVPAMSTVYALLHPFANGTRS